MPKVRRFAFWTLLVLGLFGYTIGQEIEPVKVSVRPQVAVTNPYKQTTFWFRWQIEPNEGNRRYALMYSCGGELHSSQGQVDGDKHRKTTERYVDLTVLGNCTFMACVVRIVEGKAKTICDRIEVTTNKGGG